MEKEKKPDSKEPLICLVCAWRKDCLKKFSFTGGYCAEYTRDVTIKEPPEPEDKPTPKPGLPK